MDKETVEKLLRKLKDDVKSLNPGSIEEQLCNAQITEIEKMLAHLK